MYGFDNLPIDEEGHIDIDHLDHGFFLHEQKMLYSNLKHGEITYLDDYNKDSESVKEKDSDRGEYEVKKEEPYEALVRD